MRKKETCILLRTKREREWEWERKKERGTNNKVPCVSLGRESESEIAEERKLVCAASVWVKL